MFYIDTDNDPSTGCKNVKGWSDYGMIEGYELKVEVMAGRDTEQPCAGYNVYSPSEKEDFSFRSPRKASEESSSGDRTVSPCPDGVEFSIPLETLDLSKGKTARLLFRKAGSMENIKYSQRSYTVR